jgi:uncharacterized protein (DUF924 family)
MDGNWVSELFALLAAPSAADSVVPENWVDDVLSFWFEELEPADWFKKSDATDQKIHDRFIKLYANVARMPVQDHGSSARQSLAAVIVLDQFSRNMFRGSPHSFGTDRMARKIADAAVKAGLDQELPREQRVFLYLPFEHSEDLADQERSVALISALGDERYTEYAIAHQKVIEQFGRFPHRNEVLGRQSTEQELEYLAKPGSGFQVA